MLASTHHISRIYLSISEDNSIVSIVFDEYFDLEYVIMWPQITIRIVFWSLVKSIAVIKIYKGNFTEKKRLYSLCDNSMNKSIFC